MKTLALHTVSPTLHWEDNTSCISVVESKIVTPIFKNMGITVCFIQEKGAMVYLFQNMRSLLSCYQICVPNHVEVILSIRLIIG